MMKNTLLLALVLCASIAAQGQTVAGTDPDPTSTMIARGHELDDARREGAKKVISAIGELEIATIGALYGNTPAEKDAAVAAAQARTKALLNSLEAHKTSAALLKEALISIAAMEYLERSAKVARQVADLFAAKGANMDVRLDKKASDIKAHFLQEMNAAEEAKQAAAAASLVKQPATRNNHAAPADPLDIFFGQHQKSELSLHTNVNWYPSNVNNPRSKLRGISESKGHLAFV